MSINAARMSGQKISAIRPRSSVPPPSLSMQNVSFCCEPLLEDLQRGLGFSTLATSGCRCKGGLLVDRANFKTTGQPKRTSVSSDRNRSVVFVIASDKIPLASKRDGLRDRIRFDHWPNSEVGAAIRDTRRLKSSDSPKGAARTIWQSRG